MLIWNSLQLKILNKINRITMFTFQMFSHNFLEFIHQIYQYFGEQVKEISNQSIYLFMIFGECTTQRRLTNKFNKAINFICKIYQECISWWEHLFAKIIIKLICSLLMKKNQQIVNCII